MRQECPRFRNLAASGRTLSPQRIENGSGNVGRPGSGFVIGPQEGSSTVHSLDYSLGNVR